MAYEAKYIVGTILDDDTGLDQVVAVVFPETIKHTSMKGVFVENSIRSAGFCYVNTDCEATVYGKSISLGVECNPVLDKKLVSRAMGLKFD